MQGQQTISILSLIESNRFLIMELSNNIVLQNVIGVTYITKRVLDIISENTNVQLSDCISEDSNFPEMDSITFIKIIVALENEFDFEFDDEMLLISRFPTIKPMIEYVEIKVNTR